MRGALIVHTGFLTYALIFLVALIIIALVSPFLFEKILDVFREISRAIRA